MKQLFVLTVMSFFVAQAHAARGFKCTTADHVHAYHSSGLKMAGTKADSMSYCRQDSASPANCRFQRCEAAAVKLPPKRSYPKGKVDSSGIAAVNAALDAARERERERELERLKKLADEFEAYRKTH